MRLKDENKELVVKEKAVEMIVRQGFDGFSMQKLAKEANISPATIYLYFENREDLLKKLYVEVTGKLYEATLKDFDPDMPFEEGLLLQWKNRYKYLIENPLHLYFIEQFKNSPLENKCTNMHQLPFRKIMGDFYKKAIERQELIDIEPEIFWSVAYGPLYTLLKFHLDKRSLMGTEFIFTEDKMLAAFQMVIKAFKNK